MTSTIPQQKICFLALLFTAALFADDWPQWRGPMRDGVWREKGIVKTFNRKELQAKWRTPIGTGYSGPSVADGKVFVMDRMKEKHIERVLCLDAKTGAIRWTFDYPCRYRRISYDSGPRCTPTVDRDKVYTVGAMGHLHCLSVKDGSAIWSKNYVKDYGAKVPIWGFASAPLVDGDQVIVLAGGADGAMVMAFNKATGKELWRALPTQPIGYCQLIIIKAGGKRQLIVWLPEQLVSLSPETGQVFWSQPFVSTHSLTVATPVLEGDHLLVSAFYNGPLMMKMAKDKPAASLIWKGNSDSEIETSTDKLHCMISTPCILGDAIYGVCSYGAFRCLDKATGKRLWSTYQPTGNDRWWNAFLVQHEDRTFIANEQGELIIAQLRPEGYREISRAKLIEPTNKVRRRMVVWSHPAFAGRHVFARNDREILCVSLAASGKD